MILRQGDCTISCQGCDLYTSPRRPTIQQDWITESSMDVHSPRHISRPAQRRKVTNFSLQGFYVAFS